jgi:putative ABC transport system permease protein
MISFTLKGLLTRKLRTALTAIAIILGVATVSGTFVLTDSIDKAFDSIFSDVYRNTDATITPKSPFDTGDGSGTTEASFDESLLGKVKALPDVQAAIGGVASDNTQFIKDGKAIAYGGAPNLGFSVDPTQPQFNSLTLVQGAWPKVNEVVVDKSTAGKEDLSVGQRIGVQVEGPVEDLRISGIVKFGSVSSIGGATLAGFDLATAQRLFGKEGKLDQIRVAAKPGVSPAKLIAQIRTILPPNTEVRTGDAQAREDAKDTDAFISFLRYFLLAFGLIALFVGAFVIVNSLSITIAQRTRELATLRTLGASRRQVRLSVVLEALVMGVLASIVGLFLGLGLAKGLFELFDAVGFTLPNNGILLETRTVIVSLLLGIVVTLIASFFPALRATRVPPIAAVREGAELPPGRFHRFRTPFAAVLTALGFGLLVLGLFSHGTSTVLILLILGTLLVFIGVAMLSAPFIPALSGLLGWPATKIGGAAGQLARDNARRNPQRTASTAAALMIGLALVTLVATLAAGITASFRGAVNDIFTADYAITAQNNYSPIPTSVGEAAATAPGVTAVGSVRTGDTLVFGSREFTTAVTPGAKDVMTVDWKQGSQEVMANLGANGAFVDNGFADDHNLELGSQIPVTFVTGKTKTFTVKGIFDPPTGGSPFGPVTISAATWDAQNPQPKDLYTFVKIVGGESDANRASIETALSGYPNAKVQTRQQFIDNQISGLNSVLNILYVLLALSVIVSLFGIVNTLVLTVFERTREIGMLRAIGLTRRQTRRMIRHESVITALIGAFVGIALGLILAGLLIAKVDFLEFSFPTTQVIVFTIAAIVVGILAAIFPARRAAKLDPLEALHYE